MFHFKTALPLLVLGAGFVAAMPPASARKKPKPAPTPKPTATPVPAPVVSEIERDAIYEAVLLDSLSKWKHEANDPVYVGLNRQDPPPMFIERLKKFGLHIEPMSKSPAPYGRGRMAFSKANSPQLALSRIRRIKPGVVELDVDGAGAGDIVTLSTQKGKWKVVGRRLNWIS